MRCWWFIGFEQKKYCLHCDCADLLQAPTKPQTRHSKCIFGQQKTRELPLFKDNQNSILAVSKGFFGCVQTGIIFKADKIINFPRDATNTNYLQYEVARLKYLSLIPDLWRERHLARGQVAVVREPWRLPRLQHLLPQPPGDPGRRLRARDLAQEVVLHVRGHGVGQVGDGHAKDGQLQDDGHAGTAGEEMGVERCFQVEIGSQTRYLNQLQKSLMLHNATNECLDTTVLHKGRD